jgi:hypothetical protein
MAIMEPSIFCSIHGHMRYPCLCSHFPAFLSTFTASLSAALAVFVVKAFTLCCTCFTNLSAQFAKCFGVAASSCHELNRQEAKLGAIETKLNTLLAILCVRFAYTCGSAVFAFDSTLYACIDARLVNSVQFTHLLLFVNQD